MPYPDPFYPVVDSVAWVSRLAKLGVGTVQLRAKDLDDAAALALVRDALAATEGTTTKLVVNDYWRAAIDAGARHLHLGQEDLADADIDAIRRAGLTLGISTHDDAELANALRVKPATLATQSVEDFVVRVDPESRLNQHLDYFGTTVIEFGISRPHEPSTTSPSFSW